MSVVSWLVFTLAMSLVLSLAVNIVIGVVRAHHEGNGRSSRFDLDGLRQVVSRATIRSTGAAGRRFRG
jgi:hypothetical protein